MNKKRLVGSLLAVITVWGICWALGLLDAKDPAVAELEQDRDAALARRSELTEEQRREQFTSFREKVGQLTEKQRREFLESTRPIMQRVIMERLNDFFAQSPEEQREALDRLIDAIELRRKQAGGTANAGSSGSTSVTPEQLDQRLKGMLDRTTPEMRAKFAQFREMMANRLRERGLPPTQGYIDMPR